MANVSFAFADQIFLVYEKLISDGGVSFDDHSSTHYSVQSLTANDSDFYGAGFSYDGNGVPTGGIADELRFDQDDDNVSAPEMLVTGLSLDLSFLTPLSRDNLTDDSRTIFKPIEVRTCCKHRHKGKACGNSCISQNDECHKGAGCACDG